MSTNNRKLKKERNSFMFPNMHVYASITFILAIVAFWPVYFSKLMEVRIAIHMHSVLAMLWVLLLILQSWLARKKQFEKHKKVGKLTYIITPLLVLTTLELFHSFLNTDSPFNNAFGIPIMFYDFVGLVYFCVAYILGTTLYKKNVSVHARLMVSTIMMMMFPVISRILLFYVDFGYGPEEMLMFSLFIMDAIVVLLVLFECKNGKINPVFPILLAVTISQHVGYLLSENWSWWLTFLDWYAAF
jgi:hypothetical protein